VVTSDAARVAEGERCSIEELEHGFRRIIGH
jgi:hypothetical protein